VQNPHSCAFNIPVANLVNVLHMRTTKTFYKLPFVHPISLTHIKNISTSATEKFLDGKKERRNRRPDA
jgi:hypothetical protein